MVSHHAACFAPFYWLFYSFCSGFCCACGMRKYRRGNEFVASRLRKLAVLLESPTWARCVLAARHHFYHTFSGPLCALRWMPTQVFTLPISDFHLVNPASSLVYQRLLASASDFPQDYHRQLERFCAALCTDTVRMCALCHLKSFSFTALRDSFALINVSFVRSDDYTSFTDL